MKKWTAALFGMFACAAIAAWYYVAEKQALITVSLNEKQKRIASYVAVDDGESDEIEFRSVRNGAGHTLEDDPHPAAGAVRRAVENMQAGALKQLLDGYCPSIRALAAGVLAEQTQRVFPYQSLAILPRRVDLIIQDGDTTYARFRAGEPVRRTIVFAFRHDDGWCEIPSFMFDRHMNLVAVAAVDYGVSE